MTAVRPDPAEQSRLRKTAADWRLIGTAQRFVGGSGEAAMAVCALAIFAVLWMAFQTVSLAPVDLRDDASEAALWAQSFAFGYKHPPLTAWLFMLWFAIFPRANWAMHLEAIAIVTATLAVTWRLIRDHLDRDRSLFGIAALILVPLYTYKAAELNANTVMMPFWAAALLFYLRARRGLGAWDAVLAGAFASLALLGKYWAVYLFAGMAAAALVGAGTRRFWRSPAPYLMAAGAAFVIAPHLYWYVAHAGGANYAFVRNSVMTNDSFAVALARSLRYLFGAAGYGIGPLVLLACLRPSRAALADIVWPAEDERRQALILFAVPMVLPALVNLVVPYRLTPDWTFPNWALFPVVLYGSRKIAIDSFAAVGAGLLALALSLAFVVASPLVAIVKLKAGLDSNRPSSREIAALAEQLSDKPALLYWGSPRIVGNLPFYLAGSHPLLGDPRPAGNRAAIAANGLLVVCLDSDEACQATAASLAGNASREVDGTISRSFLGISGPATGYRVTVVPAQQ